MRYALHDKLYNFPMFGCRILNAFEEWCTHIPIRAVNPWESRRRISEIMDSMDEAHISQAFLAFLALPDRELCALYNIGRGAVRFLRENTPALRLLVWVGDPDWDTWAETLPGRWESL